MKPWWHELPLACRFTAESVFSTRRSARFQSQTFQDFEVMMSIDGADPTCEAICRRYLIDSRFRMIVQPERLGWVGNINWLHSHAETEFWYFHQQDDLAHKTYVQVLVETIDRLPTASLVYCDLAPMGRITKPFEPEPPVLGSTAYIRLMAMLHEHLVAFPLRGLIRRQALQIAGPIPSNAVDNYGVDITWLAAIALSGELYRVPRELYLKRYHDRNTESRWWGWSRERKLEAWPHHCVDMLNQALRVDGTVQEMRLLWLAATERLTSASVARTFVDLSAISADDCRQLLSSFLSLAEASEVHDIPSLLDADWATIHGWTEAIHWTPASSVEIVGYGPNPVEAGEPFNQQPDGSSAIWLRASRVLAPGTRIRFGNAELMTVIRGPLATAIVPATATARERDIPTVLVGADGAQRSNVVTFKVMAQRDCVHPSVE